MYKIAVTLFLIITTNYTKSQHSWSWLTGSELCPAVIVPAVKAGVNGNSYVTAGYFGSVAIGTNTFISQGGTNSFLAMLNQNGGLVWSIPVTGTLTSYFSDIDTDANGDVYCVGAFQTASVSIGSQTLSSSDGTRFFLCKVNANGQFNWLSTTIKGIIELPTIHVTNSNVYIAGTYGGTLSAAGTTITSKGGTDYFLAKYDYSGNLIWIVGNGGSGDDRVMGITILSTGEPVVSGLFSSPSISYGTFSITGSGNIANETTLLAKYSSSGNVQWAKSIQTLYQDNGGKVSADPFGNFYFGGTFYGSFASIGNSTFTAVNSGGFISKLDTDGNVLWAKSVSAPGSTFVSDIKSDPAGSVIVFGDFNGATASIGTHSVTNDSSTTSMFLGYLDALGTSLSLETFGGKYTTNSNCLDVASNGELLIAGKTVGKKMELGNLTVNQPTNGTFMFVGKTSSLLTGINKNHQVKVQHLLYPNPCATQAYLEFNGNVEDIYLYDLNGKQVPASFEYLLDRISIHLNNISNGIYLLQVQSESRVYNYKIIKQE